MSPIYHRPDLAHDMATQLLSPGVLDQGLRSGLFLSGLRRTGKTTFLRQDLIPALENAGAGWWSLPGGAVYAQPPARGITLPCARH
jgi:hypothetical protein